MKLTRLQENGVETAIQCIYRDLDYARTLIKAKAAAQDTTQADPDDEVDIEESWTFIGDESGDPELQRKLQDLDLGSRGRPPRVSMDGLRAMQGVEPVRRTGLWK